MLMKAQPFRDERTYCKPWETDAGTRAVRRAQGEDPARVGRRVSPLAEHPPVSVCTLASSLPELGQLRCLHCAALFSPRRRRRDVKFCKPTCRAAWHRTQRERLQADLAGALTRAVAILGELRGEH